LNKNPAYRRNRLISYDAVASVYEERICQLNQGGEKTSDIGARESRVLSLKSVKARIENRMAETKKEIKKIKKIKKKIKHKLPGWLQSLLHHPQLVRGPSDLSFDV